MNVIEKAEIIAKMTAIVGVIETAMTKSRKAVTETTVEIGTIEAARIQSSDEAIIRGPRRRRSGALCLEHGPWKMSKCVVVGQGRGQMTVIGVEINQILVTGESTKMAMELNEKTQ